MTPVQLYVITFFVCAPCLFAWRLHNGYVRQIRSLKEDNGRLVTALERVVAEHDFMIGHPVDESCSAYGCRVSVDHVRAVLSTTE